MWYHHKLGQGWSTEDGMVCSLEVYDNKVDVVNMKVVGSAKLDQQRDLTQGMRGLPWEHPLERCVVRLEVLRLKA
jgi:hypothetical protein